MNIEVKCANSLRALDDLVVTRRRLVRNLENLPLVCYAHMNDGTPIKIERGVDHVQLAYGVDVKRENAKLGIRNEELLAMTWGAFFGWGERLADPEEWNK